MELESKAGSQSTERLHETSGGSDNKIPLIISFLAILIAVIGVVIAAVGLARNGESNIVINGLGASSGGSNTGGNAGASTGGNDDKIWMFSIGHADNNAEYLDEASGQIKGYHVDIVNAVCRVARKNCQLVEDIWTNCWDSQTGQSPRGGTGLMAGYYDACTAWYQTYERHRTFNFADPIADEPNDIGFAVPSGNPGSFDYKDVTGKTIGFGDGWAFDENCLRRDITVGGTLANDNIQHFTSIDDLRAAVIDRTVDAAFAKKSIFEGVEGLEIIDAHATNCDTHSGRSMMMRKDNMLWRWWNPAFAALVKSPEYQLICNDLSEQHGHFPGPTEICIKS